MNMPMLNVEGLTVHLRSGRGAVTVVRGIDFAVGRGEVLGLIGESGSGKSVTLRAVLRILPRRRSDVAGRVTLDGREILGLPEGELGHYRGGEIAMIFQEPALALDPVFTVGHQIVETIVRHKGSSHRDARTRALELLDTVRIPSARTRLDSYPHELSGGMRQRAMIALALCCGPKVLLADEPTTALDATVQMQVILLLRELQRELGMATIFVSHDLGVAAEITDRLAVMYGGRIVETGETRDVLKRPAHPYTKALLASTLRVSAAGEKVLPIAGMPPDPARMPPGCAFAPRCPLAQDACRSALPPLVQVTSSQQAACLFLPESIA